MASKMTFPKAGALFYNQMVPFRRLSPIMTSSLRFIVIGIGALLIATSFARADDNQQAGDALAVAKAWLAQIDAGNYDQSYNDGGSALHEKVPEDKWTKILKTERPPLGKVKSRTEADHAYHPNGFEGVDGEFFVVSYHTAFETKPDEIEYVVLRREGGRWHGVGYDFGPGQVVNDPDAGPTTTTSTETIAPPTPASGTTVPVKRPAKKDQ
jgi:hypothetical protein